MCFLKKYLPYLVGILICNSVGFLGSLFMFESLPTWYQTLNTPSLNPPSFVFGPVWTLLYTLMGISLAIVWKLKKSSLRTWWLWIFGLNLFLNGIWSMFFFYMQNVGLALIDLALIWSSLLCVLVLSFKLERKVFYLLVPYFLWVSFASYLNFMIYILN